MDPLSSGLPAGRLAGLSYGENCMEHLLHKMARQLDALDEASLLALWDKYATIVSRFEPTKRWEEAALVFSFIQAKRWKNQLFNHNWSARVRPDDAPVLLPEMSTRMERPMQGEKSEEARPRARVLTFRPKGDAARNAPEGRK